MRPFGNMAVNDSYIHKLNRRLCVEKVMPAYLQTGNSLADNTCRPPLSNFLLKSLPSCHSRIYDLASIALEQALKEDTSVEVLEMEGDYRRPGTADDRRLSCSTQWIKQQLSLEWLVTARTGKSG